MIAHRGARPEIRQKPEESHPCFFLRPKTVGTRSLAKRDSKKVWERRSHGKAPLITEGPEFRGPSILEKFGGPLSHLTRRQGARYGIAK